MSGVSLEATHASWDWGGGGGVGGGGSPIYKLYGYAPL